MSLSRRLARPMLASMFVVGGINSLRDPSGPAKAAEKVGVPIAEKVPGLPTDPEVLVRINGGVQFGAGTLLALGKMPRLSSLLLLGSLAPTTLAAHSYWEHADETERAAQRIHFLKNLGLAGGLLISAFDTDGAPSLGWRARRRASRAAAAAAASRVMLGTHGADSRAAINDAVNQAISDVALIALSGRSATKSATKKARKAAEARADQGRKAARKAAGSVPVATARDSAGHALHAVPDLADTAVRTGRAALAQAPDVVAAARREGGRAAKRAAKQKAKATAQAKKATARATKAAEQAAKAARKARKAA